MRIRKVDEVIDAFVTGKEEMCKTSRSSLFYNGRDKLFSYMTTIAQYDEYGNLVVNTTRYSYTTTTHLNKLLAHLRIGKAHMPYEIIDNVPVGTADLKPYSKLNEYGKPVEIIREVPTTV